MPEQPRQHRVLKPLPKFMPINGRGASPPAAQPRQEQPQQHRVLKPLPKFMPINRRGASPPAAQPLWQATTREPEPEGKKDENGQQFVGDMGVHLDLG